MSVADRIEIVLDRPPALSSAAAVVAKPEYNISMGYLRAIVTQLVVATHALLAYYPGPFPFTSDVRQMAFPVLDPKGFAGARIFVVFSDMSFMALMFFISGVFLWPSLTKKGAGLFVRDRAVRLGIPFLVCAGLIAPLAYYPDYLQATPVNAGLADYVRRWLTLDHWLDGPAWFVAALLVYDVIAAALFVTVPNWGKWAAKLAADALSKPLHFFLIGVAISGVVYVPLALLFNPHSWWHIGPFWLQKSRALVYAAYVFLGSAVGAYGINRGLVSPKGNLARRWWLWGLAAIVVFLIAANMARASVAANKEQDVLWITAVAVAWAINCAVSCFALLAVIARFAGRSRIMDSLARNAYGIYLVHYVYVTWAQYALLDAPLTPIEKGLIVVPVAVAASWMSVAALRRIPAVARII